MNFLKYRPGIRLRIPVKFLNEEESVDLKRGAHVVTVQNYLDCVCDGEIPEKLTIDLAEAKKGDVFRLSNLTLPPQVRPAKCVLPDTVFCIIKTFRNG